jgi:hypothetical protein
MILPAAGTPGVICKGGAVSPEDPAGQEGRPPDGGGTGSEPGVGPEAGGDPGPDEERSRPELDELARFVARRRDTDITELDLSMLDPETRKVFLTRLGDEYGEAGRLGAAQEAYDMAGAPDRLVALGDKFLEMKWYARAVEVYVMAGREMPVDRLLHAGRKCIAEGDVDTAAEAYQLAGKEISAEELLSAAAECMRRRGLEAARRAFSMAFRKSGDRRLEKFLAQFEGKPRPPETR